MKITKLITIIITIIVALAGFISTTYVLDARWAKADDVQQLSLRLDLKILTDRSNAIQERLWKLEDRYGAGVPGIPLSEVPDLIKEEFRKLQEELKIIHLKTEQIIKNTK